MKITPLEIRQKDFEKKLRGYDKDEVNAFLQSLSNEWERVLEETKELSLKLKQNEKEVAKLREVETSLYKTLKTAEDTGAHVVEQARKTAELHLKESRMNAEALLNESKNKARSMIEKAEIEARQIIEELQDAMKIIERNHRDIENHRQHTIDELKNLSVTLIEKVDRYTRETKEFRFEDWVKRVKQLARESEERIKNGKIVGNIKDKKSNYSAVEYMKLRKEEKLRPKTKPPKTEELRERILKQKSKNHPPKIENLESKEEKNGPRITRTVSFFDELDTDS